jgi:hypothetical protein
MIYALPGDTYTAALGDAATGLAGTVGVQVRDGDGVVVTARTTAGIVEVVPGSGIYSKNDLVAPEIEGTYLVVWDDGAGNFSEPEDLEVTSSLPIPGGAPAASEVYATSDDVAAYNAEQGGPYTLPAGADLTALIGAAQEDLDVVLGDYDRYTSGDAIGRKLDPSLDLIYPEARALMRATAAQCLYRIEMGPEFFSRPKFDSTSGPEFGTQGPAPHVSPMAMRELSGSGLLRNTTSISRGRRAPSWLAFTHNLERD